MVKDKNIEISCKGDGFKVSHVKNEPYFEIDIDNKLLKEIFKIQDFNAASFISFDNQFYIAEILKEEESILDLNNKSVRETINKQIKIVNLIERNASLIKKINNKESMLKRIKNIF